MPSIGREHRHGNPSATVFDLMPQCRDAENIDAVNRGDEPLTFGKVQFCQPPPECASQWTSGHACVGVDLDHEFVSMPQHDSIF